MFEKYFPRAIIFLENMIIDENKLRKVSEKLVGRGKGTMPSLKFHKGKSARSDTLEAARLAIGIFVAAAMLFGTAALVWTLATEAGKGIDTLEKKAAQRPADARDVQVIYIPKGGK